MKKDRISEIIGNIDDKYIDEAINYNEKGKIVCRNGILKWITIAACLTVVLGTVIYVVPTIPKNDSEIIAPKNSSDSVDSETITEPIPTKDNSKLISFEELDRQYRNQKMSVNADEIYIELPWDKKTVYEQFGTITVDGKDFFSRRREVGEALLGDIIGNYEATGYDNILSESHSRTFEARQIQGVSDDLLIAVNMDGKYYVFASLAIMNSEYSPPATLGEMLDSYNLNNTLEFNRFTVYEGYDDMGYYVLKDDDFVWQILADCRDAEFIEDNKWDIKVENMNYIEFTATSEALGIYKKVFSISDDGYLWTNIFERNYIYNIGENAANRIISYVTENSTEAEYHEPYSNSLVGEITKIDDDYILVDDSVMCKEESDGMVFKILTDDVKVSRHTEYIEVGDIIMIDFTGKIDVENDNIITEVYLVTKVFINPKGEWIVSKNAQFMLE